MMAAISVFLSLFCLLMLVPYYLWLRRRMSARGFAENSLPWRKLRGMRSDKRDRALRDFELLMATAMHEHDFTLLKAGMGLLSDAVVRVPESEAELQGACLRCLVEVSRIAGRDPLGDVLSVGAVSQIGEKKAGARSTSGHHLLWLVLDEAGARTRARGDWLTAAKIVACYLDLSRRYAAHEFYGFFSQNVNNMSKLALDKMWLGTGFNHVYDEWYQGLWRVSAAFAGAMNENQLRSYEELWSLLDKKNEKWLGAVDTAYHMVEEAVRSADDVSVLADLRRARAVLESKR